MYIFEAKYQNMENGNERKGTIMLHDGRTEDETYVEAMRRAIQMKESFECLCAVEFLRAERITNMDNLYIEFRGGECIVFEIQQKDVFAEYKWHKLNLRIDIAYIGVNELADAKIFPTRLGGNEYIEYQTFCHTCVSNEGVWAIPAKRVDFDFTVDWEYDEKNDGCKYKFRKKTGKVM